MSKIDIYIGKQIKDARIEGAKRCMNMAIVLTANVAAIAAIVLSI